MAASLPCGEFEWAVHAEHVLSAVAPVSFEYFPSAQLVQRVEEAAAAYLPALQLVQLVEPAIYVHTLSLTTLCKFLHLNISR